MNTPRTIKIAILTDQPDDRIEDYCREAQILVTLGDLYPVDVPDVDIPHLYVHGNHDPPRMPFEARPNRHDLHLATVEINGVTFGGFEGAPKYKPRGHYLYDDDQVVELLEDFPPVDVFICHAPPTVLETPGDPVHRGFTAFDKYIERTAPVYCLCGHVHAHRVARVGRSVCMSFFGASSLELSLP